MATTALLAHPVRHVAAVPLVSLAVVLAAVSGCSSESCAGQCGPPYELSVTFRPGTTENGAVSAVKWCAKYPEVVHVGLPRVVSGVRSAIITTRDFGISSKTQPLLRCLNAARVVGTVGWPD